MSGFADYEPETDRRALGAEVQTRPAKEADLDACARLIVARTGGSVDGRRRRLLGDLQDPRRYSAVACVSDEVVGYGGVIWHEATSADPPTTAPTGYYLVGLIVSPAWRRHGIGELLTIERMRWTAERADTIHYFANLANGPTLDLHARLGFTELTRDFTFPGNPLKPGTGVLLRAALTKDH
ncbi:GNAT family N-acetyltransferase [Kribbella sp. NBC_00889]|uniref:GNAT family N-acetyltransferase n=1 Tax=Kribbella sp. NBC_00889 TaxID=2975974 RepID=UPI003868AD94|nr:GNAT family N-acetyltransferase [Kribbella sp. NBC_00889]